MTPDRNDVLRRDDDSIGRHRHDGIEIARRQGVGEIAKVIRQKSVDQREVRAKRRFEQEVLAVDVDLTLALFDHRSDARRRQYAPQATAAGPDAFDERALWHEVNRNLGGHHLLLYVRIETDVARGQRRDQRCVEQLPDASARDRGVVADEGEFGFPLPDQFIQQAFRRAHSHEAAHHYRCAVGDHGDRFFYGDGFHWKAPKYFFTCRLAIEGAADPASGFDLYQGLLRVDDPRHVRALSIHAAFHADA